MYTYKTKLITFYTIILQNKIQKYFPNNNNKLIISLNPQPKLPSYTKIINNHIINSKKTKNNFILK